MSTSRGPSPQELERLMQARCKVLAGRNRAARIVATHVDPETGAGAVVLQTRKDSATAYYFRARQTATCGWSEPIVTAHDRIAVPTRLKQLIAARKAARIAPHDLKPGEIVAATWGVTMRDVHFYRVTGVPHPRKVELVEIPGALVSGDWMSGSKMPVLDAAIPADAPRLVYPVTMEDGLPIVKTGSSITHACRWNGQPIMVFSD